MLSHRLLLQESSNLIAVSMGIYWMVSQRQSISCSYWKNWRFNLRLLSYSKRTMTWSIRDLLTARLTQFLVQSMTKKPPSISILSSQRDYSLCQMKNQKYFREGNIFLTIRAMLILPSYCRLSRWKDLLKNVEQDFSSLILKVTADMSEKNVLEKVAYYLENT